MINVNLEYIDKLNTAIDKIDDKHYDDARDDLVTFRDELQEQVDKEESDIDVQIQLYNESIKGK